MEGIKIRLEFTVDIDVLKEVLIERGFEPSIANMKRLSTVYKNRQYSIKDKKFFDDLNDKEILLMYGLKKLKQPKQG